MGRRVEHPLFGCPTMVASTNLFRNLFLLELRFCPCGCSFMRIQPHAAVSHILPNLASSKFRPASKHMQKIWHCLLMDTFCQLSMPSIAKRPASRQSRRNRTKVAPGFNNFISQSCIQAPPAHLERTLELYIFDKQL